MQDKAKLSIRKTANSKWRRAYIIEKKRFNTTNQSAGFSKNNLMLNIPKRHSHGKTGYRINCIDK